MIQKIVCFIGLHHYRDCDECEQKNSVSIMIKCDHCGKVTSE